MRGGDDGGDDEERGAVGAFEETRGAKSKGERRDQDRRGAGGSFHITRTAVTHHPRSHIYEGAVDEEGVREIRFGKRNWGGSI